jgi:hypothetical protein
MDVRPLQNPPDEPFQERRLSLTEGEFPFSVTADILRAGDDIQIYVGGGSQAHIGGAAVSLPHDGIHGAAGRSCTTSVFNIPGHRDGRVAEMFADAFCRAFGCAVCVSAGVHVDGADEADVKRLLSVCAALLERSVEAFGDMYGWPEEE